MQNKRFPKQLKSILLILATLLSAYFIRKHFEEENTPTNYFYQQGQVFGTFYHIIYESNKDRQHEIDSLFVEFDNSLSSYNKHSIISKINKNEKTEINDYFKTVFTKAKEYNQRTNGAFDITIAPLIDAWGFGSGKKSNNITSQTIDSLMQYIGMDKINMQGNIVTKTSPHINLNTNAIAKGYGVDVIADYFENIGLTNYLVEIGGEIRALGYNAKGKTWTTAINKPIDDSTQVNMDIENHIILMPTGAMATSGNYRNFYIRNGKKYAHTINPKTGYPVSHTLLSATVYAPTCIEADAFATAFMVLGTQKAIDLASKEQLAVYFIFEKDGKQETYISKQFMKLIKK